MDGKYFFFFNCVSFQSFPCSIFILPYYKSNAPPRLPHSASYPTGADARWVRAVVLHLNAEEQSGSAGELSSQQHRKQAHRYARNIASITR